MLVGVWLANSGHMLGNTAGAGHGVCKQSGFRLPKEAFLLLLGPYLLGHGYPVGTQ